MVFDSRFTEPPEGWPVPDEEVMTAARAAVEAAVHDSRSVDRLAAYYSRTGNFAGATFSTLGPVEPYSFTTGDLLALTLLNVSVGPAVVRRLLEPSRTRGHLLELLSERNLPMNADLALADADTLLAMESLHAALKQAISPTQDPKANPWVTASKLSARKRPDLFPVRDSVVCHALGLDGKGQNYQVDWQVYRSILQDESIRARLDQVVDEASRRPGVDVGSGVQRLRHLDVAVWMHHRRNASSLSADATGPD